MKNEIANTTPGVHPAFSRILGSFAPSVEEAFETPDAIAEHEHRQIERQEREDDEKKVEKIG